MNTEFWGKKSDDFGEFSNAQDPMTYFEESGCFRQCYPESHRLYFPQTGEFCGRKQMIWDPYVTDEWIRKEMVGYVRASMPDRTAGDHMLAVKQYKLQRVNTAEQDVRYDLYMMTEPLQCFPENENRFQGDAERVYAYFFRLCSLLKDFYRVKHRSHNNINHRNIFLSGNQIVLGNHSMNGAKNDVRYYNAPEILRGETYTTVETPDLDVMKDREIKKFNQSVGSPADIYSLGVWLYFLLRKEDQNVFAYGDSCALTPSQIQLRVDGVPEEAADVIRKAVSTEPSDRYQSFQEMEQALQVALGMHKDPKNAKIVKMAAASAAAVLLIGGAVLGIVSGVNNDEKKIRDMIQAGAYTEVCSEIAEMEKNEQTDMLIKTYIQQCRSEQAYEQIVAIVPMFSQEMFDSPEYLRMLFFWFREQKQLDLLTSLLEEVGDRSPAIAEIVEDLYE